MKRKLVASVSVGALLFSVYLAVGGNVAEQSAFLADGGYAPNRVATCPVRIAPNCLTAAVDAGIKVRAYERLRFPVSLSADGGLRDVQLPPMRTGAVHHCVEVLDWADCTLDAAAAYPAVAAMWGDALPFSVVGVTRKCVRPRLPSLPCPRRLPDGGPFNFGDRNVFPRAEAVNPATCETVECGIVFGDDPEVDL